MSRTKQSYTAQNVEVVKQIAIDAYVICSNARNAADMSGHDYAYKAGYARNAFRRILIELGMLDESSDLWRNDDE